MGRTAVITILLLGFLISPARSEITINLLEDGSFESGSGASFTEWSVNGLAYRDAGTNRSGTYAARITTNGWSDYSFVYQDFPSAGGQTWRGTMWGLHHSTDPLTGSNRGWANISFLDANTNFIFGTASPQQLTAATPTDQWVFMTVEATAPRDTAFVRFNAMLWKPGSDGGSAWFDDAAFGPASTSMIQFAGRTWIVNNGSWDGNPVNVNVCSTNCVSVDTNGWLHLRAELIDGLWWNGEIKSPNPSFGYGEYRWQVHGRPDLLETNLLVSLFTYNEAVGGRYNEIDIEFARTFSMGPETNCYYTCQPWEHAGNQYGAPMVLTNTETTHRYFWRPDEIYFQSYYGFTSEPASTSSVLCEWTYQGADLPDWPARAHMLLWRHYGLLPLGTQHVELVIRDFIYKPYTGPVLEDDFGDTTRSNIWNELWYDFPDLSEADGLFRVAPSSGGATEGYIASAVRYRAPEDIWTLFGGVICTMDVTSARSGDDIAAVLAFLSGQTDSYTASNAITLEAHYDDAVDTLTFELRTKTNAPSSWGSTQFVGVLTNASANMGPDKGIDMRFALAGRRYFIQFHDEAKKDLPVVMNDGAWADFHGLGTTLDSGCFVVAARNMDSALGAVSWDRAYVEYAKSASVLGEDGDYDSDGYKNGAECAAGTDPLDADSLLRVETSVASSNELVLTWESSSNRYYRVWGMTNLQSEPGLLEGPFWSTPPVNTYTADVDTGRAYFKIQVE